MLYAKKRLVGSIVFFALGLPVLGLAQTNGFDAQQLNLAPSQTTNLFGVHQARILTDSQGDASLVINHAANPLVVSNENGERIQAIISAQTTANVLAAFGIADIIEIGVDIPVLLYQAGDSLDGTYSEYSAANAGFGIGDIRIVPSYLLMNTQTDENSGGMALAFILNSHLPTGNSDLYQGGEFRIEPRFAFDFAPNNEMRLSVNAGYMTRLGDDVELDNLEVNDAMTWGLGMDFLVSNTQDIHFIAEFNGEASVAVEEINSEEIPFEALLGGKYFLGNGLMAQGGFGMGVINGYGTPDWRALLGITYVATPDPDRDLDGIINEEDVCPDTPEDFDNFEDEDGCPELDNDQDGILDTSDACVMDPEDFDNFEDEDGCPEADNDQDGILDGSDSCVLIPEDFDGYQDEDGCPEEDNDGDGILDTIDGLNDGSGFGACRNDPEDPDGFEDEDGCPEPDNDNDGILDGLDACPEEPEDFDGEEDEDGCPEEGSGNVQLTCNEITIAESVQFRSDSDEIRERSYELLDQVASVMRSASYIHLVQIEGHTDSRGSDSHNLELSQRRAASVMNYLIQAGIEPSRMISEGFGETQPIADNDSRDGRHLNRRVNFVIIEQDSDNCIE